MTRNYVIGLDYGSDSVRAILLDVATGEVLSSAVNLYSRWGKGLYSDSAKSQFRHHPLDYIEGLEDVLGKVIADCPAPDAIKAIGIDCTASTLCLADENCVPLSLHEEYQDNPDAMFVLWKDHTATLESAQINELCNKSDVKYNMQSGFHYSAECYWSKVIHLLRNSPELRQKAHLAIDVCDWLPALLCGCTNAADFKTGKCIASIKLMWSESWGGYPPAEFFEKIEPAVLPILKNIPQNPQLNDKPVGTLCKEWAEKLGLSTDVVIGTGLIDSYSGGIGAGVKHGTIALNLGTSSCYMATMPVEKIGDKVIEGLFGQAKDCIIPGMVGFEAGLSAFGDAYAWVKRTLCWSLEALKKSDDPQVRQAAEEREDKILADLNVAAAQLNITENTPVATDHINGRRSPEPSSTLKSGMMGISISTTAPEIFYAYAEATAFGTRYIMDHLEENGVDIYELIGVGGIAQKSPFVMQLLADACGKTIHVSSCNYSCALGAAICASVAAGIYPDIQAAQKALCPSNSATYNPNPDKAELLEKRYEKYRDLSRFSQKYY